MNKEKVKTFEDIIKKNPRMMDIAAYMYNMVHRNNSWRYCLGRNKIKIRKKGAFLNRVKFEIKGINNTIVLGRKTRLNNCHIVLWGNNCVLEIGGGNTIVSNTQFWLQDDNSTIVVGKDFTMEGGHIASTEGEKIVIGNDCMFSNDIEIRNGDSHTIIDITEQRRTNYAQPVIIGNHVWLTAHTRVLKGSRIAHSCIIANSAVVSGILEKSNTIYGGLPAKPLKEGIDWDRYKW